MGQHPPVPIPDNPRDPWLGTCARCGRRLHVYDGYWRHRRRD